MAKIETVKRLQENVPAQLRALPQWVLWRYEDVGEKKPKKPPFTIDGQRASIINPETWTTFPKALQAYTQREGYEGLGVILTGGLTVIDLDNCYLDLLFLATRTYTAYLLSPFPLRY